MANTIDTRQRELEINMAEIKTELKYMKKGQDEISQKLDKFIDTADEKFATKAVEEKVKTVECQQKKINQLMAKMYGGALVLWIVVQLLLKFFFNV